MTSTYQRLAAAIESAHRLSSLSEVPYQVFRLYRKGLGWRYRVTLDEPTYAEYSAHGFDGEWFSVDEQGKATCCHQLNDGGNIYRSPFSIA